MLPEAKMSEREDGSFNFQYEKQNELRGKTEQNDWGKKGGMGEIWEGHASIRQATLWCLHGRGGTPE
jgi:hypothetical protein